MGVMLSRLQPATVPLERQGRRNPLRWRTRGPRTVFCCAQEGPIVREPQLFENQRLCPPLGVQR